MHETALFDNLIHQIQALAEKKGINKIKQVNLKVGILFPVSPEHLRNHFHFAAEDTPLEEVTLNITVTESIDHPDSKDLIIESIEQG